MSAAYASETVGSVATLSNSAVLNKQTGTASGGLLVACLSTTSTTPGSISSSGFTVLTTSDANSFVLYKIAGGSEPSTYTFTRTGSNSSTMSVSLRLYTGADATTPIAVVAALRTASGTSVAAPSVTATNADTILDSTCLLSGAGAATFTAPGGMTQNFTDNDSRFACSSASEAVGSGATGTRTWSSSRTATITGFNVAINSAVSGDATVNAPAATATASGAAANVSSAYSAAVPAAASTASATAPAPHANSSTVATASTATGSGVGPALNASSAPAITRATATASAVGPTLQRSASVSPTAATATGDATSSTLNADASTSTTPATATADGVAASFQGDETITADPATATATGRDAAAGSIVSVTATAGTATAAGAPATPSASSSIAVTRATASAGGAPATVTGGGSNQIVTVTRATATATGSPATFSRPNSVTAPPATATAVGRQASAGNKNVTITPTPAAATAAASAVTQTGGSDALVVVDAPATAAAVGAAISTGASTGVRLKARWHFYDPNTSEAWEFPINPNKMASPHSPRNLKVFVNPPLYDPAIEARGGMARVFEGNKDPYEWSFSGYIRTEQHYRDLLYWSRKVTKLHLTDHLDRTWVVRLVEFDPDEKRPTLHRSWRMDYEIKAIMYGARP